MIKHTILTLALLTPVPATAKCEEYSVKAGFHFDQAKQATTSAYWHASMFMKTKEVSYKNNASALSERAKRHIQSQAVYEEMYRVCANYEGRRP